MSALARRFRARPGVEALESRLVPYGLSGNAWPNPELVTLSFAPDGTVLAIGGGGPILSNLLSTFDNHSNPTFRANWRKEVLRAAAVWAQQTNINFAVVGDDGSDAGSGLFQQGDPAKGDIRIGGYALGSPLGNAYSPPSANNYSIAGDVKFNTAKGWNIGSTYDLFSVAVHEFGHALGLNHSPYSLSVMHSAYGLKTKLYSDDVNGIRAIYGGPRAKDAYDAAAANGTVATASDITSRIDGQGLTALLTGLDVTTTFAYPNTTTADVDFYTFTAPEGTSGTLEVKAQSAGLSLLAPTLTLYAGDGTTVLGTASGAGQYGTTLTVTVDGVAAGQRFYVKVAGADTTALGAGGYALTLNFGTGETPAVPLPDTQEVNGDPLRAGGAQAQIPGEHEAREDGPGREVFHAEGHDHDHGNADRDDGQDTPPVAFRVETSATVVPPAGAGVTAGAVRALASEVQVPLTSVEMQGLAVLLGGSVSPNMAAGSTDGQGPAARPTFIANPSPTATGSSAFSVAVPAEGVEVRADAAGCPVQTGSAPVASDLAPPAAESGAPPTASPIPSEAADAVFSDATPDTDVSPAVAEAAFSLAGDPSAAAALALALGGLWCVRPGSADRRRRPLR
jgi:hypothetical protein